MSKPVYMTTPHSGTTHAILYGKALCGQKIKSKWRHTRLSPTCETCRAELQSLQIIILQI